MVSFYGIAETNEIEINYNLPVLVKEVFVKPGEFVNKGVPLFSVQIVKTENQLLTNNFEIEEIKAKEKFWEESKSHQIQILTVEQELYIHEIDQKIKDLKRRITNQKSFSQNLNSLQISEKAFAPLIEDLDILKKKRKILEKKYSTAVSSLKKEKEIEIEPMSQVINKLGAELQFEEKQLTDKIIIYAPTNGIVGEIYCKPNMHFKEFGALMNFYQPRPDMVKGFVHENSLAEVQLGDYFKIASTINDTLVYNGTVTGLGSRIIEVPTRLRKNPSVITYGREITITIDKKENHLLQKERVILELSTKRNIEKKNRKSTTALVD